MRRIAVLSALLVAGLGVACGVSPDDGASTDEAIGAKNLTANAFGLQPGELVLTLDDGPGARTIEVAKQLAEWKVPAVFFSVGKNAKANQKAVAEVVRISNENDGLFIVGNHSMTHTTPLPQQGYTGARNEILNADAVLTSIVGADGKIDALTKSQEVGYPTQVPWFRPPYGAFTALGTANIDRMNRENDNVAKYKGPIFWDIGGELKNGFSADWACWGKNGVSVEKCKQGYMAEAQARKRGIILVHDVHSKTIDMLLGTNGPGTKAHREAGLIGQLEAKGFKFVGMRSHEAAVQEFIKAHDNRVASTAPVTIDANVEADDSGKVTLKVRTDGGEKVEVSFDNEDAPAASYAADDREHTVNGQLGPGQHFVTVEVMDGSGKTLTQQRYTFIVAAPLEEGSAEANDSETDSPDKPLCVNFDLLKKGNAFRIYNKKVADYDIKKGVRCPAGSWNAPGTGHCYKYAGRLEMLSDPKLVGARDWSLDLELSYDCAADGAADPAYACSDADVSRVSLVMDADTGEITTAQRYWPNNKSKKAVPMDFTQANADETRAQCTNGVWYGKFLYASGAEEEVMFRMVRNPQTGKKIRVINK